MLLGGSRSAAHRTTAVDTTEVCDEANLEAAGRRRSLNMAGPRPRQHHAAAGRFDGRGRRRLWDRRRRPVGGQRRRSGRSSCGTRDGDWQLGPSQAENRAYHSTALAACRMAGWSRPATTSTAPGVDGTKSDTAEIYSPPYLFKGPVLQSAPRPTTPGWARRSTWTPSAGCRAPRCVAPGATTHANDMNQRFIQLAVSRAAGRRDPARPRRTPSVAPPGYYMLFLINAQGVPSVAKMVQVIGTQ